MPAGEFWLSPKKYWGVPYIWWDYHSQRRKSCCLLRWCWAPSTPTSKASKQRTHGSLLLPSPRRLRTVCILQITKQQALHTLCNERLTTSHVPSREAFSVRHAWQIVVATQRTQGRPSSAQAPPPVRQGSSLLSGACLPELPEDRLLRAPLYFATHLVLAAAVAAAFAARTVEVLGVALKQVSVCHSLMPGMWRRSTAPVSRAPCPALYFVS